MMDPRRCAILVPTMGPLEPETEDALSHLADRGYPVRLVRGASQIDLARSMMATVAIRDGFAETLWIDSDVVFQLDAVEKIRGYGLPMVAGLYVKKGARELAAQFLSAGQVTLGAGGSLREMRYVGMGFTHVRRAVYDAIRDHHGFADDGDGILPYFLPILDRQGSVTTYLSEDYSFCHRARTSGFPPMADTTIRLGHVGRRVYTWDDLMPTNEYASVQLQVGDRIQEAA